MILLRKRGCVCFGPLLRKIQSVVRSCLYFGLFVLTMLQPMYLHCRALVQPVKKRCLRKQKQQTPQIKKMQFEHRNEETTTLQNFTEQRIDAKQQVAKEKTRELTSKWAPLSILAQLVLWFKDVSFICQYFYCLQFVCKTCSHPHEDVRLLNFPKYPVKLQLYYEIFITASYTCLLIHVQHKKRLSMGFRATFPGRCFIF